MKCETLSRGLVFRLRWALLAAVSAVAAVRAEPGASSASADAALRGFLNDPDLCAYMVATPDGESARLLRRYTAAAAEAVQQLRLHDHSLSDTAALFQLRAACDRQLGPQKPAG